MHGQHDVCVFEKVSTSNHMLEVARNRAAFRKSKPGRMEVVNPLVSTPVRGFTGIYIDCFLHCKHDYKPKASKLVVMSETAKRAILVDQNCPQYINLKLAPRNSSHPIIK